MFFPVEKMYEAFLEPGDVLFLPAFWFHQVYVTTDQESKLSVSSGFFLASKGHFIIALSDHFQY